MNKTKHNAEHPRKNNSEKKPPYIKTLSKNRRALKDFTIEEALEVGIVLTGSEVKPVRRGEITLTSSYAIINLRGEIILKGAHIKKYEEASYISHEPKRERRLLAHKKQISKILLKMKMGGYTLVPLEMYIKNRWIKISLALVRGKRKSDKRQAIKSRDASREMDRAMKASRNKPV